MEEIVRHLIWIIINYIETNELDIYDIQNVNKLIKRLSFDRKIKYISRNNAWGPTNLPLLVGSWKIIPARQTSVMLFMGSIVCRCVPQPATHVSPQQHGMHWVQVCDTASDTRVSTAAWDALSAGVCHNERHTCLHSSMGCIVCRCVPQPATNVSPQQHGMHWVQVCAAPSDTCGTGCGKYIHFQGGTCATIAETCTHEDVYASHVWLSDPRQGLHEDVYASPVRLSDPRQGQHEDVYASPVRLSDPRQGQHEDVYASPVWLSDPSQGLHEDVYATGLPCAGGAQRHHPVTYALRLVQLMTRTEPRGEKRCNDI